MKTRKINLSTQKISNSKTKNKEILELQQDWNKAKSQISQQLSKEKNSKKKQELRLLVDYLENNYVDLENGTISSKQEKKDSTIFCSSKEFEKRLWRS